MRTTVTLDPDAEQLVKQAMKDRGLSFKEVVNEAIRSVLGSARGRRRPRIATYDMGEPKIDLTKALQISGELEDEARLRALAQGK